MEATVSTHNLPKEQTNNIKLSTAIIKPGESFRTTQSGELSVCSFNLLAPSYHWIGHEEEEQKKTHDREQRVPMAIDMAKQTNADVLLLQEVEGGESFEPRLKQLLRTPIGSIEGYDQVQWAALHPNRNGDVVGLAVAWRSRKHMLISSDEYRRGMVLQLEELDSGATFCVGNVHLPAKPADIEGRLKTMATTIRKVDGCESPIRQTALDSAIIIGGDFNCDHNSPTVHLLTTGSSLYGTVRDRNYKTKISKDEAAKMRHRYRFQDIYAGPLRETAAPVTVSLHGRGPGCMDHMLYTTGTSTMASSTDNTMSHSSLRESKRRSRRVQALARAATTSMDVPSLLRVESVLATVDPDNPDRTHLIHSGLPQVEQGFPSDHLPIGALFVPEATFDPFTVNSNRNTFAMDSTNVKPYGLGWNTKRRQESYQRSVLVRQRHNAVLRAISEWLIRRGAIEVIRDQPLYKWKWTKDVKMDKKMRAPDLCCVLGKSLVIVEVTVASKPEIIRREKELKYSDLAGILGDAPAIVASGLVVLEPFIIVIDESGDIPESTQDCLDEIARLSSDMTGVDVDMDVGEIDSMDGKRMASLLRRVVGERSSNIRL